jgi:Arc/MetJ family transcription regulator
MCIGGEKKMRTNIVLDDKLIHQAMKLSGLKTKKMVVEESLKRLVKMEQKKKLLELQGKVEFWPDYDYKARRQSGPKPKR